MTPLNELREQIVVCKKCPTLAASRTQVVPGDGAENAAIMFVGEAPGFNEDKQGLPFVGQAGAFLNELLGSINFKREQVYITNVIKCRPPENRDPLPYEIQNCRPWLDAQIATIKPRIIVLLGRYALASFLPDKSISKIHGTAQRVGDTVYFALYHPAAALYQQSLRETIKSDFLRIPGILAGSQPHAEAKPQQQLSMF
ncbi:MAG: uracil-DNA glycosylase [Chloroflexota bacterium]